MSLHLPSNGASDKYQETKISRQQDINAQSLPLETQIRNLWLKTFSSQDLMRHQHQCLPPPIFALLSTLFTAVAKGLKDCSPHSSRHIELVLQRFNELIGLAKEKFYVWPFRDVPKEWMAVLWWASVGWIGAIVMGEDRIDGESKTTTIEKVSSVFTKEYGVEDSRLSGPLVDQMIRTTDMALIMAGPPPEALSNFVENFYMLLYDTGKKVSPSDNDYPACSDDGEPSLKRRKLNDVSPATTATSFPTTLSFIPPINNPIPRIHAPSLSKFQDLVSTSPRPSPFITTGAIDHWPALEPQKWRNPQYLLHKTLGGRRLVPVEVGRSYVDEGWGQKIIPFKDFLNNYICRTSPCTSASTTGPSTSDPIVSNPTGYLAQHNLFTQIPPLRNDILTPDYCFVDLPAPPPGTPRLDEPLLNAWFGPAGTISPLHTDPYENLLAQVVGRKYVRLYAPSEGSLLSPRGKEGGGIDMGNTSEVDVGAMEGWDSVHEGMEQRGSEVEVESDTGLWDRARNARYVDCILEEGECLFIPAGWWHYVRSLSVSFSVSFWFN